MDTTKRTILNPRVVKAALEKQNALDAAIFKLEVLVTECRRERSISRPRLYAI